MRLPSLAAIAKQPHLSQGRGGFDATLIARAMLTRFSRVRNHSEAMGVSRFNNLKEKIPELCPSLNVML